MPTPVRATYFQLHNRALHALTESLRVAEFTRICNDAASSSTLSSSSNPASVSVSVRRDSGVDHTAELGLLLNESHYSCRDLYDCTHDMTNKLQELCLANGAIGSRQTGECLARDRYCNYRVCADVQVADGEEL
jgi:galactokinase